MVLRIKITKFATKKWSKGNYSHENPIKFLTSSSESNLCDYSDAFILVAGNITVTRAIAAVAEANPQGKQPLNAATPVAFKNCASFEGTRTEINDMQI